VLSNIIAACENHSKHINTLCEQNADFFNVEAGGRDTVTVVLSRVKGSMYVSVCPEILSPKPFYGFRLYLAWCFTL
jgi:hypothetical protein